MSCDGIVDRVTLERLLAGPGHLDVQHFLAYAGLRVAALDRRQAHGEGHGVLLHAAFLGEDVGRDGERDAATGGQGAQVMGRLGYAAIIIEGKPADDSLHKIFINKDGVKVESAADLKGLGNYATYVMDEVRGFVEEVLGEPLTVVDDHWRAWVRARYDGHPAADAEAEAYRARIAFYEPCVE